jgi:hypothetical protein
VLDPHKIGLKRETGLEPATPYLEGRWASKALQIAQRDAVRAAFLGALCSPAAQRRSRLTLRTRFSSPVYAIGDTGATGEHACARDQDVIRNSNRESEATDAALLPGVFPSLCEAPPILDE